MGEAKTDKQVSQTALTQVEKQAEALSAEIKTVAAGLKAVEEKTKALDAIGVQMAKIQAEVGKAVGDKLDAKALATALEQERKTYREMMTQVTRNWEKQIEGLQLKVAMIERLASMPRPPSTPASPVTAPSAPPPGGKTGSSGVFNEQDIKEVR
jgi:chromosome segregation ATPase